MIPDKAPKTKMVKVRIRLYCANCWRCGTNGKTAAGTSAFRYDGVASVLPRGSWVNVPGFGWKLVNDTGGALRTLYKDTGIVQVEVCSPWSHWRNYRWGHVDSYVKVKQ